MCLLAAGLFLGSCGGSSSTVKIGPTAAINIIPKTAVISPTQAQSFSATAVDANGNTVAVATFGWTSSAPNVASIDGTGLALGRATGTTQITASATGASNTVITSAASTLTVSQPIASITISPRTASIAVNGTQQFTASAVDAKGNAVSGVTFSWACSFSGTATIDGSGLATGVGPGTVTIVASAGGMTSTPATLTVTP